MAIRKLANAGSPQGLFLWHHLAPRTVRPPSLPAGHAHHDGYVIHGEGPRLALSLSIGPRGPVREKPKERTMWITNHKRPDMPLFFPGADTTMDPT